jgi:hypothetical protein
MGVSSWLAALSLKKAPAAASIDRNFAQNGHYGTDT